MNGRLLLQTQAARLSASLDIPPRPGELSLWWLGQAGFLVKTARHTILIDPYLSDALARKYQGAEFPHRRMMAPPVRYEELQGVDLFCSTHAHSDHLDAEGLECLALASPECLFMVPASAVGKALERGVPRDRMIPVDGGEAREPLAGLTVQTLSSAHEEVTKDAAGHDLYLGYVLRLEERTLYHSGDCVPYPGLAEILRSLAVDLALLPVNGRDVYRAERGVPGNFHYREARELINTAHIPYMIPHHYGMFDFNTVVLADLQARIKKDGLCERVYPAQVDIRYRLFHRSGSLQK